MTVQTKAQLTTNNASAAPYACLLQNTITISHGDDDDDVAATHMRALELKLPSSPPTILFHSIPFHIPSIPQEPKFKMPIRKKKEKSRCQSKTPNALRRYKIEPRVTISIPTFSSLRIHKCVIYYPPKDAILPGPARPNLVGPDRIVLCWREPSNVSFSSYILQCTAGKSI